MNRFFFILMLSVFSLNAYIIEDVTHLIDTLSLQQITVSDSHKFAWYRVSKAGSQSIANILKTKHIKTKGYTILLPKHKHYFKFAFVRNPWDRVVSMYFDKVVTCSWFPFRECFGKDFEYFVDYIDRQDISRADKHIRQQTDILPLRHMDFIGRFENFTEDLQYVLELIGIEDVEIPKKNASEHQHYSHYYNEGTQKIIADKYAEDLEVFGYVFETY